MMNIWAIGDLHLSIGLSNKCVKEMSDFGEAWYDHATKIEVNWRRLIAQDDLVLVPGDLCWANRFEDAFPALKWLATLPGKKVLIKGNHDNWWVGNERLQKYLPEGIYAIRNNALMVGDIYLAGSKGWTYAINENKEHRDRMLLREYKRMRVSLDAWPKKGGRLRILMTHYPPFNHSVSDKRFLDLLDEYSVDTCIFGHLHGGDATLFQNFFYHNKKLILVSADKLDFSPLKLYSLESNSDTVRYISASV